jgi:hypothetical protein
MKMIWVTDTENKNKVAIAADKVIIVFTIPDGQEKAGNTVIVLTNGQIMVDESDLDIVGMLEAQ